MRRSLLTLVLLVCFLAAPAAAEAGGRLEGIPAEVRTGEHLEIRWSGLERGVHEVELELSLGGARWVRISPELEALDGRFVWRVPAGLAGAARIRLRAGGEDGEREVAEQRFHIVGAGPAGPGAALGTPGWWDLGPHDGPAGPGAFGPREAVLSAGGGAAEAVTVSPPDAERAAASGRSCERREPVPPARQVLARGFAAPRHSPLRN